MKEKVLNAKQLMILNARAYNKMLTTEHLSAMGIEELLANVHPSDRERLQKQWENEKTLPKINVRRVR